jgi:hypothetical protein
MEVTADTGGETTGNDGHDGRRQPLRNRRMPLRYRDILPTGLPSLPQVPGQPPDEEEQTEAARPRRVILHVRERLETQPNVFGLFKKYFNRPTTDPDGELTLEILAGLALPETSAEDCPEPDSNARSPYYPFPNATTYLLSHFYLETISGQRSAADLDRLIEVIQDRSFIPHELKGFSVMKMNKLLDKMDTHPDEDVAGWHRDVAVVIQVPEGRKNWSQPTGRAFTVPGLHYRSIPSIIKEVFSKDTNIHYTPFELWWQPDPSQAAERVYSDIYCSKAFEDAHRDVWLSQQGRESACVHESAVAALMVWSDSTHLAQFGTAKLWPIYLYFGNHAKWFRARPSAHLAHHLAYIPPVSRPMTRAEILTWSPSIRRFRTQFRISYASLLMVRAPPDHCAHIASGNSCKRYGH